MIEANIIKFCNYMGISIFELPEQDAYDAERAYSVWAGENSGEAEIRRQQRGLKGPTEEDNDPTF